MTVELANPTKFVNKLAFTPFAGLLALERDTPYTIGSELFATIAAIAFPAVKVTVEDVDTTLIPESPLQILAKPTPGLTLCTFVLLFTEFVSKDTAWLAALIITEPTEGVIERVAALADVGELKDVTLL